jgi:hypothetical protein
MGKLSSPMACHRWDLFFEHIFQKMGKNGTKSLLEREGNGTICTRLMRFAVILL